MTDDSYDFEGERDAALAAMYDRLEQLRADFVTAAYRRLEQVENAGGDPLTQIRAIAGHLRDLATQYAQAAALAELAVVQAEAAMAGGQPPATSLG